MDTEFVFVCNFCGFTYQYLDKFCTFYVDILSCIWHEFCVLLWIFGRYSNQYLDTFFTFYVNIPSSIWTRNLFLCEILVDIPSSIWTSFVLFTSVVKFSSIFLVVFGQVFNFLRRYKSSIWTRFAFLTSIYLAVFDTNFCFVVKCSSIFLSVFGQVFHFLRRYT